MKCMNMKGLEAYQEKKNLKKLEETLRNKDWSEMSSGSHRELKYCQRYISIDANVERYRDICLGRCRENGRRQLRY